MYSINSKTAAENFTTSGTPNTQIDAAFWKPGASRAVGLIALRLQGKAAGATSLSGIVGRLGTYPTTASSGGTAITPAPVDGRAPAAVHSAGAASAGVTSGTGSVTYVGGCGCGVSGPGGWVAPNPDAAIVLDANTTGKSLDLFVASATASLSYEFFSETTE